MIENIEGLRFFRYVNAIPAVPESEPNDNSTFVKDGGSSEIVHVHHRPRSANSLSFLQSYLLRATIAILSNVS